MSKLNTPEVDFEKLKQEGSDSDDEEYENLCGVVVIGAPGTGKTTFCNAL